MRRRGFGIYLILIIMFVWLWYSWTATNTAVKTSLSQFYTTLENGNVVSVDIVQNIEVPTGALKVIYKSGTSETVYVPDINRVIDRMDEAGFKAYTVENVPQNGWMKEILPLIISFAIVFVLFTIMMNAGAAGGMGGGGTNAKMMNFGKSRAQMIAKDDIKEKFDSVAGLHEEKEELEEIVDFLKNPAKFTSLGARIPKGIILVGPPGTGKTLLAKAIAGEAGVPFFSISGSDFVEMFVGVGASRVRDLFADAKRNAPCIVFIDEIDAVARRRGTGMGGGHDEREQTLNQMLVEMDGFSVNEGIIVLAATNRVDILDPAIMRPGRFDRKVYIGKPDVGAREEILKVHASKKPLSDDVDLEQIARTTAGFTGADLENLLNEAAIKTARDDRKFISFEDIKSSFVKVGIGTEKKSRIISDKEKKITAYHEAGHALLFHLLPEESSVYSISIIPTGAGAAGYTMPLPEKDEMFRTKSRMLQDIVVSLGGRAAEQIIFGDVTTGASADIKSATGTAKAMVTTYGMSEELGLINYDNEDDEVFIGRDLAHAKGYSEAVAAKIDAEVKRIIDESYKKALEMINANIEVLHRCAERLLEKEKIGKEEFESLFEM